MKKGTLIIISGPSAVGKTSVADEILNIEKSLSRIVTCTTRNLRKGEINGRDYFFMTVDEFLQHKVNGDFAEFAEVYGNYYGVLISTIKEKIDNGLNTLLVINWEGFLRIKKIFSDHAIGFFLVPPTIKDLENRIRARGTDSEEIIKRRIDSAMEDMQYKDKFDHCVENKNISEAANEILRIASQKYRLFQKQ